MNQPQHDAPERQSDYDYSDRDRPQDCATRSEIAEQQEILQPRLDLDLARASRWQGFEYDF